MDISTVVLAGNVVNDPVYKNQNGNSFISFRIACEHTWRDGDTWKSGDTLFIEIQAWGRLARHSSLSIGKGCPVMVAGRLTMSHWETEPDELGQTHRRSAIRIKATHIGPDLNWLETLAKKDTKNGKVYWGDSKVFSSYFDDDSDAEASNEYRSDTKENKDEYQEEKYEDNPWGTSQHVALSA